MQMEEILSRVKATGMLIDLPREEEEAFGDMLSNSYETLEAAISAAYEEYAAAAEAFVSIPRNPDLYQKVRTLSTRQHEVPGFNHVIPWCYFVISSSGCVHILH